MARSPGWGAPISVLSDALIGGEMATAMDRPPITTMPAPGPAAGRPEEGAAAAATAK